MPGSHFRRSHHVAVVVEHVDALRQLRVSHEHHVADVCTRCGEARVFLKNESQVSHLQELDMFY